MEEAGAPALEAYPFDAEVSPSATGTGYASTFARAGFRVVARRDACRPIMRHDLQQIPGGMPQVSDGPPSREYERVQPYAAGTW